MARAGLVRVTDAVFRKANRSPYRKVNLMRAAYSINETTPIEFIMKEAAVPAKRKGKESRRCAKRSLQRGRNTRPKLKPVPRTNDQGWLQFWRRGGPAHLAIG